MIKLRKQRVEDENKNENELNLITTKLINSPILKFNPFHFAIINHHLYPHSHLLQILEMNYFLQINQYLFPLQ